MSALRRSLRLSGGPGRVGSTWPCPKSTKTAPGICTCSKKATSSRKRCSLNVLRLPAWATSSISGGSVVPPARSLATSASTSQSRPPRRRSGRQSTASATGRRAGSGLVAGASSRRRSSAALIGPPGRWISRRMGLSGAVPDAGAGRRGGGVGRAELGRRCRCGAPRRSLVTPPEGATHETPDDRSTA